MQLDAKAKSIDKQKEDVGDELADIRKQLKKREEKLQDSEEDVAHRINKLDKKEKEVEKLQEDLKRGQVRIGKVTGNTYQKVKDGEKLTCVL